MVRDTTPSGEALLTRYRMFTTDDGGLTLRYEGYQDASDSTAALRQFFPPDKVGHAAAVSENSFKIRNLKERPGPVIETEPVPWPDVVPEVEPAADDRT